MRSYVVQPLGIRGRIGELWGLYRMHSSGLEASVRDALDQAGHMQQRLEASLGRPLKKQRMLEIGVGQRPVRSIYFAVDNDVVGIDLDLVTEDFGLKETVRLMRTNGPMRGVKTLARKILGFDRKFIAELARQIGSTTSARPALLQMDAARLDFPGCSFDVVFSHAVFEHLPEPARAIEEACRVLKPGGVMFVVFHLYTSDSGCHDLRILSGSRGDLPMWPHLRPEHAAKVRQNSYLNKLSLADWRAVFAEAAPGCEVTALMDAPEHQRSLLAELRSEGALEGYTDEDLLTITVEASWCKPRAVERQQGAPLEGWKTTRIN